MLPELCRECRVKALLAQAPINHNDILEDDEDKRLRLEAIGEVNEDEDGDCEREGLLGKGARGKKGMTVSVRKGRGGWLKRFC